jgi:tetratricopeptide (TPR) repeat protein
VAALGIGGAAVAVALTRADASAVRRPGGESTAAVLARLAELPHPIRPGAPRLSLDASGLDSEHTMSRAARHARAFVRSWTSATAGDTSTVELARLAAVVSSRATGGRDPLALHAAALVDLRWGDARAVVRASALLEHALRLIDGTAAAANTASLHADLAAASLLRADREGDARLLLVAVEHAHRALRLDSASLAARYNLALALQRFGVGSEASGAGREYLARDSTSRWARAVRAALPDAASPLGDGPPVGDTSPHASTRTAPIPGTLDLQARRELGWEVHLPAWGDATLAHDTAEAARQLRAAAALGIAVNAAGGDASLTDVVAAIARRSSARDARSAAATTGHARAVVAYASGLASYRAAQYEVAAITLGSLTRAASAPAPLRAWARLYLGAALVHAGHLDRGAHELRRVIATADAGRYPALVGRAYASLGTAVVRKGLDGELRSAVAAAEPLLARAHEPENLAAVQSLGADGAFVRGDAAEGTR